MALPTLDTATYNTFLPSTSESIKYRPFLVKEYKILMMSLESDQAEVSRTVYELVDACTFNKLEMKNLSHFDVEFIFLQLRAKSIGEITEIIINCDCGNKIKYDLDINNLKIRRFDSHSKKIQITDNIGVIMRYPRFDEIIDIYDNLKSEKIIEMVSKCIESVYDSDEIFKNFTKEEIDKFVNSFTKDQFDKLENFFVTMPKVYQNIDTSCDKCNKIHKYDLEGLQNFFV